MPLRVGASIPLFMNRTAFQQLIFGSIAFPQKEEYDEFRYKFLIVLMLSGALVTALFIAGEYTQVNLIHAAHMRSMRIFTATAIILWAIVRNRKHLFKRIAWTYEIACLFENTSALVLVPHDELRILWFFLNVPGVYILLGQRAGMSITALSVALIYGSNQFLSQPYSSNAMATAILSLLYLGAAFHVYGARSMSYLRRMHEYNLQLNQLASHDMLTGVLNARAYYATCKTQIDVARRTQQPYAVLFVDLDHFKSVNDKYGHSAGDAVLKTVAQRVGANIRSSDTVGRIGGEEFSVFMPNTPKAGAIQLAESLRKAIESCNPSAGELTLCITASIGVAVCDRCTDDMPAIQQKADQAMYVAKSMGRNRVSAFDDLPTIGAT